MRYLRKYIKLFIALALPVYILLLANSICNMHVHVLSNGMVVRHAHPMNGNNESHGDHEHTRSEISYYQGFFIDYFDNAIVQNSLDVDFPVLEKIAEYGQVFKSFQKVFYAPLRAPPVS